MTYLTPKFDTAKSFYNKAYITRDYIVGVYYTVYKLYSYNTPVALVRVYDDGITTGEYIPYKNPNGGDRSRTTERHIKEFFRQFGVNYTYKR